MREGRRSLLLCRVRHLLAGKGAGFRLDKTGPTKDTTDTRRRWRTGVMRACTARIGTKSIATTTPLVGRRHDLGLENRDGGHAEKTAEAGMIDGQTDTEEKITAAEITGEKI